MKKTLINVKTLTSVCLLFVSVFFYARTAFADGNLTLTTQNCSGTFYDYGNAGDCSSFLDLSSIISTTTNDSLLEVQVQIAGIAATEYPTYANSIVSLSVLDSCYNILSSGTTYTYTDIGTAGGIFNFDFYPSQDSTSCEQKIYYVTIRDTYGRGSAYLEGSTPAITFSSTGYISTVNNTYSSSPQVACPVTSFSVAGVDFGRGLCNVAQFLFVPNQSILQQWPQIQTTMGTHIPFSYFSQITTALQDTPASTTTSTIPTLTINTGTNTPIQVSANLMSPDTFNKYTTTGSRAAIRVLLQVVLYLLFITMIVVEVRNIFKSGGAPPSS